jgi:hypothetical protein
MLEDQRPYRHRDYDDKPIRPATVLLLPLLSPMVLGTDSGTGDVVTCCIGGTHSRDWYGFRRNQPEERTLASVCGGLDGWMFGRPRAEVRYG